MKNFLAVFPVPKYLSLGSVSCAVDYDTFRFIEFRRYGKNLSVTTSGMSFLPSPVDKTLKPAEDVRKFIGNVLSRAKKNNVSLVIPEQSVYVFTVEIPFVEPKLIREAISFKLEQYVPIAAAEALFEYDVVATDSVRETLTVAVRVVPRSQVESLVSLVSSETVLVTECETESTCLSRAVSQKDGDVHLIVHIGRASTVFVVTKDGIPFFSSTLAVGSVDISSAVAKVFSVPLSQVSKIRSNLRGSTVPDKKLLDALIPTLSSIRDEMDKVVEYWNTHLDSNVTTKIKSIFLSGQDVVFPSIMTYLELSAVVPITIADVWRNVTTAKNALPPIELESALGFAPTIGAALRTH